MKREPAVLLAEDEALIAMDLSVRLKNAGCGRVRIVATGEEALAWAGRERFDVIIMDNHLAGSMDGVETAARLRAEGAVPFVFITGYPKEEICGERTPSLAPFICLEKPVDFNQLLAAIEALLS